MKSFEALAHKHRNRFEQPDKAEQAKKLAALIDEGFQMWRDDRDEVDRLGKFSTDGYAPIFFRTLERQTATMSKLLGALGTFADLLTNAGVEHVARDLATLVSAEMGKSVPHQVLEQGLN